MPLPRDSSGWSIYTPSGGGVDGYNVGTSTTVTRAIHVASDGTGSDAANGSAATPYATINMGMSRIRNGSPDWLLLKVGNTFLDQSLSGFNFVGRNANERIVASSYHPSLPLTPNPGASFGAQPHIMPVYNGAGCTFDGSANFIAIEGLRFHAYTSDPQHANFVGKSQVVTFTPGSPGRVTFPAGTVQTNMIGQPGAGQCVFVATSGTLPSPLIDGMTRYWYQGPNDDLVPDANGLTFLVNYILTLVSGTTYSLSVSMQANGGNVQPVNLASAGSGTFTGWLTFARAPGGAINIPNGSTATAMSIDDCEMSHFDNGLTMTTDPSCDLSCRRNRIHHIYAQGIDTFTKMEFQENLVDACAWQEFYPYGPWERGKDQLLHNMYISCDGDTTAHRHLRVNPLRGNIVSRDTSGSQIRCGGINLDNFWYDCPAYPHNWGMLDGATDHTIAYNIYYECQTMMNMDTFYGGYDFSDGNCLVEQNITISPGSKNSGDGSITIQSTLLGFYTVRNNISWGRNLPIANNATPSNHVILSGNNESPGHFNNFSYPNPGLTVANYMVATFGGSHVDLDFITAAMLQRKGNWDTRLTANAINNYFRVTAFGRAAYIWVAGIILGGLSNGTVGVAYSGSVAASGGSTPYSYAVTSGSLPAGLSLNASTGAVTGTPTTATTYNFTITATDSTSATGVGNYILNIASATGAITLDALGNGTVGTAYSDSAFASGGTAPYTYAVFFLDALPGGLSLNTSTGLVTGTPTTAGTFIFTIRATDNIGTIGNNTYTMTIAGPTYHRVNLTMTAA